MQIYIIPLDFDNEKMLDKLSLSLQKVFKISTCILPIEIQLKKGWSFEREQLNSTWLLSQFLQNPPDDCSKLLGITVYDLYTPILTYLFGEAELRGRAAVFSIYRFQDELYGLPANKENLENRMIEGDFTTHDHTGTMVPIFAYGPHSQEFQGVYENIEVFGKILKVLNIKVP